MRFFLARLALTLLYLGTFASCAWCQKEISDSVETSVEGRNAQSDELFFNAIKAKMHNDDSGAKDLFTRFAEERPEVSDPDYELARYSHNDRNYDKAESYIKKAIALDANNKWYQDEYASILADKGDYAGAAAIMSQLNTNYPDDRSYPQLATEYYEHALNYEKAIFYLDKAIEQVGYDEDLMIHKVQIYLDMKELDKASGVLNAMIAKDPKNPKYYKMLGEFYDNNDMPEKAAKVFDDAQRIIPDDPNVELGLVNHYRKIKDTASYNKYIRKVVLNKELDAETQLDFLKIFIQSLPNDSLQVRVTVLPLMDQLLEMHPNDAEVLELDGILYEILNQADKAIPVFRRSLAIKPANYKGWISLLELCSERQYADSLLKFSKEAIKLFPNQGNLHYFNGLAHYYRKEYNEAIMSVNRAIDMMPDSDKPGLAGMYSFLGDIYHAEKQDDQSDVAYKKALELQPDNASTLNNYSYYLSERGVRLDEAEKLSKKSLELRPDEATFLDTYGWILYKKGQFEKAKEYISKAVQLAGTHADATLYDHLGNVYYKLNEREKAVENWKIAKEKGDDDPFIDKKIAEGKLYE